MNSLCVIIEHFLFNTVEFLGTQDDWVQRLAHIFLHDLFEGAGFDFLVGKSDSGQGETLGVLAEDFLSEMVFGFQQLFNTNLIVHESRGFIDFLVLEQGFGGFFFHPDV